MKIVHVINSLETGGAEMMLLKLLQSGIYENYNVLIIVLSKKNTLSENIKKLGFNVEHLNFSKNIFLIFELIKFYKKIKFFSPNIVHSWLYHANLITALTCYLLKIKGVIWSIRQTSLDFKHNKLSTLIVAKICALISKKIPLKIIYNSYQSKESHTKFGYCKDKNIVIFNGFNTKEYKKIKIENKKNILGSQINTKFPLVGFIGRYDVQKNHFGFFEFAKLLVDQFPRVNFILVGRKIDEKNKVILNLRKKLCLDKHVYLLGERKDIPKILNALDVFVLPSNGESFPNVVGEAMACEVPTVVTDVGASKEIVGDLGFFVNKGDMLSMAKYVLSILKLSKIKRENLGKKCRLRIKNKFNIKNISNDYKIIYEETYEYLKKEELCVG